MIAGLRLIPIFLFVASLAVQAQNQAGAPPAEPASTPIAPPPTMDTSHNLANEKTDPAVPMLKKAYELLTKKDLDGALTVVDEAVKNNPKSFAALTLRGMIYSQKKEWTSADSDFEQALAVDPSNVVVKFNLGEIKFVQKDYDGARARFAPLTTDAVMGDFASYKVFLCDLLGNHIDVAKKELDVFNAAETHPSYYFANAAWALIHTKNVEDARSWLTSASNIYQPSKNQFYAESLRDLGYLPLPAPTSASN